MSPLARSDSQNLLSWSLDSVQKAQIIQSLKLLRKHSLSISQIQNIMNQYEMLSRRDYLLGSPRVDQLLTLIQFNVFRALLSNTNTMGFGFAWLEDEDALSPFLLPRPTELSTPASLLPTALQRTIPHHPWIDLFPFPHMRDNLLLAEARGGYDEWGLCNDLVDFCNVPAEKTGLIVWTEPWDPSGWEVSEAFLQNWPWVLSGCRELMVSTNFWRERRGEETLAWEG
jgi:hypothetical protein